MSSLITAASVITIYVWPAADADGKNYDFLVAEWKRWRILDLQNNTIVNDSVLHQEYKEHVIINLFHVQAEKQVFKFVTL